MCSQDNSILSESQQTKGMKYAYIGQSTGILFRKFMVSTSIGPLFIKALGGSDLQAMLLGSILFLGMAARIPASLLIPQTRGKRFMLRAWLGAVFLYFAGIGLTVVLPTGNIAVWVFLFFITAGVVLQTAGASFWWPLLHDVVPDERRGRFFGTLRAIWQMVLFLSLISAGFFLGKDTPLWKYQITIAIAASLMLWRNIFVSKIPEQDREGAKIASGMGWRDHLRTVFGNRATLIFFGYFTFVIYFASFLNLPVVLYMNNRLGFSPSSNTVVFSFRIFGMVLALLFAGKLVDLLGTKKIFLASHVLLCVVAFLTVLAGICGGDYTKPLMIGIFILSGATHSAANLAATTQVFHLSPIQGRPLFMNMFTLVIMIGYSLAPFTAGVLTDIVPDAWSLPLAGTAFGIYEVMFAVSGIILLFGSISLFYVEDKRVGH